MSMRDSWECPVCGSGNCRPVVGRVTFGPNHGTAREAFVDGDRAVAHVPEGTYGPVVTKAEVTPEQFYGEVEYRRLASGTQNAYRTCVKHGWNSNPYVAEVQSCPHCIEDEKILAEKAEAVALAISPDPSEYVYSPEERRDQIKAALLDFAREVRR